MIVVAGASHARTNDHDHRNLWHEFGETSVERRRPARPAPSPGPHLHDRGGFYVPLVKNPPRSWGISAYEQDQTRMVRKHRRRLLLATLTTAAAYELAATHGPDGPWGTGRCRWPVSSGCWRGHRFCD